MPNKTNIEWTDYTSNPIVPVQGGWGCSKVSPGCDHCYAETLNKRLGNKRDFTGRWTFRLKRKELMDLETTLRNKGHQRVFMCDMTDLFHSDVSWEYIYEIFQVMCELEQHTFQLLTKRPGRMAYFADWLEVHGAWWPPNVWAGTSVESQKYAPRLDVLVRVPAKVRFVSVEPMLGPVDLKPWLVCSEDCGFAVGQHDHWNGIHWVIIGGESGPRARPMDLEWAWDIIEQCSSASVPCFMKQLGSNPKLDGRQFVTIRGASGNPDEWPPRLQVRQFPGTALSGTVGAMLHGRDPGRASGDGRGPGRI